MCVHPLRARLSSLVHQLFRLFGCHRYGCIVQSSKLGNFVTVLSYELSNAAHNSFASTCQDFEKFLSCFESEWLISAFWQPHKEASHQKKEEESEEDSPNSAPALLRQLSVNSKQVSILLDSVQCSSSVFHVAVSLLRLVCFLGSYYRKRSPGQRRYRIYHAERGATFIR